MILAFQFVHCHLVTLVQRLIKWSELCIGGLLHCLPLLILLARRSNLELVAIEADGDSRPIFGKEYIAASRHAFLQHLAEVHDVPPFNPRVFHIALKTPILHGQFQGAVLRVSAIAVDDKSDGLSPFGNRPLNVAFHLPLPRHYNECEQRGDDSSLQSKAEKPSVLVHICLF